MKVVMAGGTGYIGAALGEALTAGGHEVVVLTRRPPGASAGLATGVRMAQWDPRYPDAGWAAELRGADALINLSGANVGSRPWTPARQREILDSRLHSTGALVKAAGALPAGERPRALVNASGVDYYGDRGEETLDEDSPAGDGALLAQVCSQWEAAAREAESLGLRVVRMRTGVVLSRRSSALGLMALPFRLFAGGPVGSGRQWVSWIHLADVVGLYTLAAENETVAGAVNAVAPEPVRNADLASAIGRALRRPSWLRAPAPPLRLVLGRQAEVLLVGHRVTPKVALALGYSYRYPTLAAALADALGPGPRSS